MPIRPSLRAIRSTDRGTLSLFIPVDYNASIISAPPYFDAHALILADEGHPVFELNASAVLELTGQNLPAGNYAVVENNESTADLEPALQDENGTWLPPLQAIMSTWSPNACLI